MTLPFRFTSLPITDPKVSDVIRSLNESLAFLVKGDILSRGFFAILTVCHIVLFSIPLASFETFLGMEFKVSLCAVKLPELFHNRFCISLRVNVF